MVSVIATGGWIEEGITGSGVEAVVVNIEEEDGSWTADVEETSDGDATDKGEEASVEERVNVEEVEETENGRKSRSWLRKGYAWVEGGWDDMTETNLLLSYSVFIL